MTNEPGCWGPADFRAGWCSELICEGEEGSRQKQKWFVVCTEQNKNNMRQQKNKIK